MSGKSRERIIKQAKFKYIPFTAVDTQLRKKVYNGIIHWLKILAG